MKHLSGCSLLMSIVFAIGTGCQTAPKTDTAKDQLMSDAESAWKQMVTEDPGVESVAKNGAGYIVFPKVGKGAWIVGGSYGRGIVYERGTFIGYADITQATIGLQAGGQSFQELVVFETQTDLDRFKTGKFSLAANLSAVALKTGASKDAKFKDGVIVFTKPVGGLMFEAAVGGQQFTFQPK
jgi:lipid-binding SYLF domain-containing protein